MRVLVSPINPDEARAAMNGGADIIDVKNPKEGSLGANFPWMIREVKSVVGDRPLSATIGDLNFKPGTASQAALGAAVSGADYVKAGLYDIQTEEQAREMMTGIARAVKDYDGSKKVVAAGYADYHRINSISPLELPAIVAPLEVDVVMMDTGVKDGKSLFDFMSVEDLTGFCDEARDLGLETALAGSIKFEDLEALNEIGPDIIGVRGCVCGGDRNTSIKENLVEELVSATA